MVKLTLKINKRVRIILEFYKWNNIMLTNGKMEPYCKVLLINFYYSIYLFILFCLSVCFSISHLVPEEIN